MKTMVDNVCTLVIEASLISAIETIFSPSTVIGMDDDKVSRIATESADSVSQRAQLTRQRLALQSGLAAFKAQLGHSALSGSFVFTLIVGGIGADIVIDLKVLRAELGPNDGDGSVDIVPTPITGVSSEAWTDGNG